MRWSNFSGPIPTPPPSRAPPGTSLFWGLPKTSYRFFLPCHALINHFNPFIFQYPPFLHFIFQCLALFYHTHFSFDARIPEGIGVGQIDQCINDTALFVIFKVIFLEITQSSYAFQVYRVKN